MTRWLAVLLLLASACEKKKAAEQGAVLCTQIGCSSGAELKIGTFAVTDVTPTAAATAQIEVCLNKQCSAMPLRELPSAAKAVHLDGAAVIPNVTMSATIDVVPPDMISVVVNVEGDANVFKDGDIYRVTIKSTDNRVLSDRSWSVTYRITQPNGPQCGPTCAQPKTMTEAK